MRLWRRLIGGQRFVIAYLADNLSGVGECSFPPTDNSFSEKASPKRKITGGFSAAILRGSSGIKKRDCRPCKASGGHRESTPENCITLRANVQQSTHETAIVFVHWSSFSGLREQLPSSVPSRWDASLCSCRTLFLNSRTREFVRERTLEQSC